ncbi:MAG: hypothetical protein PHT32_07160 [Candidatus Omnitrophica bacterium]|nr:hypothetical protein [Candidatus Omnitrophota bacterium]
MRLNIHIDWHSWFNRLDYKKAILIAFLLRVIFASVYDIGVSVAGKDVLLPDGGFYSAMGRYIQLMLNGNSAFRITDDMAPRDTQGREIFASMITKTKGGFPRVENETGAFLYIVGIIYFLFGYFPIFVRLFNIVLSLSCVFFIFRIAGRHFGETPAKIFLIIGLFLPTQFVYSITLSKDFTRMFIVCFILWLIYGGVRWRRA